MTRGDVAGKCAGLDSALDESQAGSRARPGRPGRPPTPSSGLVADKDRDSRLNYGDASLASLLSRTDTAVGEMFREVHGRLLEGIDTTFPLVAPTIARRIGAHGGPPRAALLILTMHAHGADFRDNAQLPKCVTLGARAAEYLAAFPSLLAGVTSDPSDRAEKSSNALVILIADFALSRSLLAGAEIGAPVAADLGRVAREACEGGQMDAADRYNLDRPIARYLSAVALRVGGAFGFAAALGAELAGAPRSVVAQARRCGCELGVAYQIAEDVRNVGPAPADSVQERVSALRQGRYPLPLLLGARRNRGARETLREGLASGDLPRITDRLRVTSALTEARELLEKRILWAKTALRGTSVMRPEGLIDLCEWIGSRQTRFTH